ncbi:tautomerase family protein [Nesterenkonia lutea]|uniref:4-oxalocrotonate tautomerase n=1 Tax=Nesterenkonia lutea TaxID=272919 RepID=A0ABR9JHZ0_9MICC|nr:4-oxalocrotonate tautomerase [Nesterenkonia lutea]
MPYVHVQVAENDYSDDQKRAVMKRIVEALDEEMGRAPQSTNVVIQEIPKENWGVGFETIASMWSKR